MHQTYLEERKPLKLQITAIINNGNHKSPFPKMLMDCIQFAVVMRANTNADTHMDRKSSLGQRERRQMLLSLPHSEAGSGQKAGEEDQVSCCSTLLQKRDESPPADKYLSTSPVCPSQICIVLVPVLSFVNQQIILFPTVRLKTVQTMRRVLEEVSSPQSWYMHKKRVP